MERYARSWLLGLAGGVKEQRVAMTNRKRIVWNKNSDTGYLETKGLRRRPFIPDVELTETDAEKFALHLQKGSLWRVAGEWLSDVPEPLGYELPPHPYVQGTEWQPYSKICYKKGTLAVYLGTTRVEEAKHGGQIVSVPRHTFMIDGNVYMVRRLLDLEPVS